MNHKGLKNTIFITILLFVFWGCSSNKGTVVIVSQQSSPRETFGVEQLSVQLKEAGYTVELSKEWRRKLESRLAQDK